MKYSNISVFWKNSGLIKDNCCTSSHEHLSLQRKKKIDIYLCLRACAHAYTHCICLHVSIKNVMVAWLRMIALLSRDKALGIFQFLFLNGDVLFARGESDKHVQHRDEARSGNNFEQHLISISCIYSSFSWHSDRMTSVEKGDRN